MNKITLIKKTCGHYGIVREDYKPDHINCSQCETQVTIAPVTITHKKTITENEFPEITTFNEIKINIKKILRA